MKPFDSKGNFISFSEEHGGLRRLAVRGASVTVFSSGLMFAIQLISTIVLARLLVPSDFGLVAMVSTFSILLVSVGQIGFPEAVIQREEIDHWLASNLFWINVGTGFLLTVAFAGAGSLLAKFYHDPRVTAISIGMSLTIFLTSTSVLHLALLKRGMRFTAISANDVISRMVSVAVSVSMGFTGWGYWALVGGAVAQPFTNTIGAWILCRWMPSFPKKTNGTGSMLQFATHVYGRFGVDYFARNMDNLLVGWRFGSTPLGFYKKAYDLFALPSNQLLSVFPVAVSTLSRLINKPAQYRKYFVGGLSVLALVGMWVGADLTLTGQDLVRLVLGPGWETSGKMFMFFGPGIGLMLIYGTHGMIHLSSGNPKRWLWWGIIEFVVTGILFLLALPWGPYGIACAWTISFWILIVPAFWYAGKPIQFGVAPVFEAIWKYLLASLLSGVACALLVHEMPFLHAIRGSIGAAVRIVVESSIFTVLYLGAVVLVHRSLAPLHQFAGVLRDLLPHQPSAAASPEAAIVGDSGKAVLTATVPE